MEYIPKQEASIPMKGTQKYLSKFFGIDFEELNSECSKKQLLKL